MDMHLKNCIKLFCVYILFISYIIHTTFGEMEIFDRITFFDDFIFTTLNIIDCHRFSVKLKSIESCQRKSTFYPREKINLI